MNYATYAAPRPAPRAPSHAEQVARARRWAAHWDARWNYAVDGFRRHYGLSEVEAMKRVVRELPTLVRGRDDAHSTLRRLGAA